MANFILVTGGARSGKSAFAESVAKSAELPVTYIATAQIWDREMSLRIAKHRLARPPEWTLIEEPLRILETLQDLHGYRGVILLDCVTLWLTNLLLSDKLTADEILAIVREVAEFASTMKPQVIFVTNEVGQGIVPENALARTYRDLAGYANQLLAQSAGSVFYVISGYPLEIKQNGQRILDSLN